MYISNNINILEISVEEFIFLDEYNKSQFTEYKVDEIEFYAYNRYDNNIKQSLYDYGKTIISENKNDIHDILLYSSINQRKALLYGILSELPKDNKYIYLETHYKKILNNVKFLCNSLGIYTKHMFSIDISKYSLRILCHFYITKPIQIKYKYKYKNKDEYIGFSVSGNNKRFLLHDFTVVHNSSLLGVLTHGELDNGRGKSRTSIFNFKHEINSGRSSSIAQHILGYNEVGEIINYKSDEGFKFINWHYIYNNSQKLIVFYDLCGHEKYLKTTIYGFTSNHPDLCLIIIAGNKKLNPMTKEHIFLCLILKIPFCIIITKIDLCKHRENVLKNTEDYIHKLLKLPGVNKISYKIKDKDDVLGASKNIYTGHIVPIFKISNVTGEGIEYIKSFFNYINSNFSSKNNDEGVELYIDYIFSVPGIGTVVGGHLLSGHVKLGDKVKIGPTSTNLFLHSRIKGIHHKRVIFNETHMKNTYYTFALQHIKRNELRRGMVLLNESNTSKGSREFIAQINILKNHSTTIRVGFEPVIHICNIRQVASIIVISNIMNMRSKNEVNDGVLKTGDSALVTFKFTYRPEYIKIDQKIIFCQGKIKGIGVITEIK